MDFVHRFSNPLECFVRDIVDNPVSVWQCRFCLPNAVDTVIDTLAIFSDLVPGIAVNAERMREAANRGYATATDLADYLVGLGLPFREAHEAVARAVRSGIATGRDLKDLSLVELREFAPAVAALVNDRVYAVLTPEGSVASRNHVGGTAPNRVREAIQRARARLAAPTIAE